MTLYNITISQLRSKPPEEKEEYINTLMYLAPVDYIPAWPVKLRDPYKARGLNEMTIGEVAFVKQKVSTLTEKVFEMIFGIPKEVLLQIGVVQFFGGLNWIKKEISDLVERESCSLAPGTSNLRAHNKLTHFCRAPREFEALYISKK